MLPAGEDPVHDISAMDDHRADLLAIDRFRYGRWVCGTYHGGVSSQDRGGWPDYPPSSGEAAEGPDILEQGRDRPPTRWRPTVRWRRPPAVAVILGVAGLFGGLAAGYAAGTLHAEKATAPSAQSSATASSRPASPVFIGGTPDQFQLLSGRYDLYIPAARHAGHEPFHDSRERHGHGDPSVARGLELTLPSGVHIEGGPQTSQTPR
jgi:hypothetical protein